MQVAGNGIPVTGSLPDGGIADVANWLAEIESIRANLRAENLPDLPAAETAMVGAIENTQAYFRRTASNSNYEAWMRYLDFEPLVEAIEDEESIPVRGRAALALMPQMRGVERGLELSPIVRLRDSLDRYVAALRYSDPKRGLDLIERQLDGLVELLSPGIKDPQDGKKKGKPATVGKKSEPEIRRSIRSWRDLSSEQLDQMALFLNGLEDAGQGSRLTAMIRSRFTQPNMYAWINGKKITDAVARPVNNPNEVDDCILGTRLRGQAQLTGTVTAELLPQDGYVRMLLRLDGDFRTTARGFRKPVTLDSTGTAKVYSARQLAITQKRVVLGETITTADLSTQIQRINHPLKIVRKIAMRKARESKPLAERISEQRLHDRVQTQFDQETSQVANREFPDIDAMLRPWLGRLDFPKIDRTIGSTSHEIYANARIQRSLGFSAASVPPPAAMTRSRYTGQAVDYLATIQVHESVVSNTIARLVAGQTFTPDRIARIAEVLGQAIPKVDHPSDEKTVEEFEIDFANFRPVYIEADQQTLRLGLRATRLSRGDRELKSSVEVTATYRPVIGTDATMWLIRDEDIAFSFSSSRRLTIGQTAIKANMEEGFEDLFPLELLHREFPVPPEVKAPALAGRRLKIGSVDLTDGWISVTFR